MSHDQLSTMEEEALKRKERLKALKSASKARTDNDDATDAADKKYNILNNTVHWVALIQSRLRAVRQTEIPQLQAERRVDSRERHRRRAGDR